MGTLKRRFKRKLPDHVRALPPSARYLQVKHYVLERIAERGAPKSGERVPSENELVRRAGRFAHDRQPGPEESSPEDGVLVRRGRRGYLRRRASRARPIPSMDPQYRR